LMFRFITYNLTCILLRFHSCPMKFAAFWNATLCILVNLNSEMSVHIYQAKQYHIPDDNNLHFVLYHY
jgi:hypothetical protein